MVSSATAWQSYIDRIDATIDKVLLCCLYPLFQCLGSNMFSQLKRRQTAKYSCQPLLRDDSGALPSSAGIKGNCGL